MVSNLGYHIFLKLGIYKYGIQNLDFFHWMPYFFLVDTIFLSADTIFFSINYGILSIEYGIQVPKIWRIVRV
jgi:hypothetical protein